LAQNKSKSKDAPKQADTAAKQQKEKSQASAKQSDEKKSKGSSTLILAIVVIIVIAVAAGLFYSGFLTPNVPFSTFKSNAQGSPRLSITATYSNQSQYANESTCFTSMIQVMSHTRQPSTIDFFIIDKQTNVCTYSTTGLGGSVNPVTTNSTYCLSKAYGEDGIFLNYSNTNSTTITPSHLFIYGNDAYLERCPIAIELS
jgi:cytoskeletal protein RodZ